MQKEILYNLNTNIMGIEKNPWQQAEVKQTEKLSCRDTAFLLKKVKR